MDTHSYLMANIIIDSNVPIARSIIGRSTCSRFIRPPLITALDDW